jgi:chemotaxis methyl-accepting protein methylase
MSTLRDLAALITSHSGVHMGPGRMRSLAAALARVGDGGAAAAFRAATGEGGDRGILQRLIDEVTVKETFFLRDAEQLAAIDWPALLVNAQATGSGHVRVWSAACATGEEPYTLAMLATEALGGDAGFVRILGTDIASVAVAHARRGRYHPRALRKLEPELISRHFSRAGDTFLVGDHLREMVEIRQHNLARDETPLSGGPPFDLILCRNVLIYFETAVVEHVIRLFGSALRPDGTLLLGASDRLCVPRPALDPVLPRLARGPKPASTVRRRSAPLSSRRAEPAARAWPTRTSRPSSAAGKRRPPVPETARQAVDGESPLLEAVRLADSGRLEEAVDAVRVVLDQDSMNAPAHFVRGAAELALGQADAAVAALKRALYVDGAFALAAFQLGRAYDALGQHAEASGAYRRALRTFDPDDRRHAWLLGQVDLGDLAGACRARLGSSGGAAALVSSSSGQSSETPSRGREL